jgi:hypothetical protein
VPKITYVKGVGICESDEDNNDFLIECAAAYYKMGFDMPDMRHIGKGFNRNEDEVKKFLFGKEIPQNCGVQRVLK